MKNLIRIITLFSTLSLIAACDHSHDLDADGGDEHGHGGLVAHGHEPGVIAVTHFTNSTELFVEYPPLVVGEDSAFAAHLSLIHI